MRTRPLARARDATDTAPQTSHDHPKDGQAISRPANATARIVVAVLAGVVAACTGATTMPQGPPTVAFHGEADCRTVAGRDCGFAMCDFVPDGMSFDEVCGHTFQEGWQPDGADDADHDEQLVVDQLAACDIAEVAPASELGVRHLTRDDGIVVSLRGTSAAIEAAIEAAVSECGTTVG